MGARCRSAPKVHRKPGESHGDEPKSLQVAAGRHLSHRCALPELAEGVRSCPELPGAAQGLSNLSMKHSREEVAGLP
eukprot:12300406-Alexandrium_andersonii.AAC.1